jgi:hypothetical protein
VGSEMCIRDRVVIFGSPRTIFGSGSKS